MKVLRDPTPAVRVFLLTVLGIFLVQSVWVLVVPPFRGMDEHDHAYKAAAVAAGDWGWQHVPSPQGWGAYVQVPAALPRAAAPICESLPYTTDDNCGVGRGDRGEVEVASSASQYNPAYYGFVGTVAKAFSGTTSLYVMRLATALVCAVLIGLAAAALRLWARTPWPAVGLVVATTPIVTYSTSIVAPNGVELAAAALVWCALLGLARTGTTTRLRSRLVVLATVGAVPLVTVRSLGPLWLALILLTVAVLLPREVWRWLPRSRTTWACVGVVGLCLVAAVAWTLAAGTNALSHSEHFEESPWPMMPKLEILWLMQAVAAFPARDELAPLPLYAVAAVTWWVLLAAAVRAGTARTRAVLGLTALLSLAVPAAATAATFASEGTVWQGRYGYPYALGFWVLCGFVLDRARLVPRRADLVVVAAGIGWGVTQTIGQLSVLVPQSRKSPLAHSSAWLQPPVWLVVVLSVAATAVVVRALLDRAAWTARPVDAARATSTGPGTVTAAAAAPSLPR